MIQDEYRAPRLGERAEERRAPIDAGSLPRRDERNQTYRTLRGERDIDPNLIVLPLLEHDHDAITTLASSVPPTSQCYQHQVCWHENEDRAEHHEAWQECIAHQQLHRGHRAGREDAGADGSTDTTSVDRHLIGQSYRIRCHAQDDAVPNRPGEPAGTGEVVGRVGDRASVDLAEQQHGTCADEPRSDSRHPVHPIQATDRPLERPGEAWIP